MDLIHQVKHSRFIQFLIFSFFAGIVIILLHHYTTASLGFPKYNDHLRHLRFAYEFLFRGWHIYDTYLLDFAHIGSSYSYEWPNIIYLYPLGIVWFFVPFALLAFSGVLSFGKVAFLLIATFFLFAHINTYLLANVLLKNSHERLVKYIFIALFYLLGCWWALHGQYESLVAFCLLVAANQTVIKNRFLWLVGAFFLKLQAMFFLPMYIKTFWQGWRERVLWSWQFIVAYIFLAANALMILTVRHQLIPRVTNPIHISTFSRQHFFVLGVLVIFAGFAVIKKRWKVAAVILTHTLSLMIVGELQGWYLTLLFVTPAFLAEEQEKEIYMLWFIVFLWVMHALPSFPAMSDILLKGLI